MSIKTKFKKDWLRLDLSPHFTSLVEEIRVVPYKYRCNA